MKKLILLLSMLAWAGGTVALATEKVDVKVKGMVCSFCAQGLTKKFTAEPSVSKVNVSLEKKTLGLELKDGKTLSDKEIKAIVEDSGYETEDIKRNVN